MSQLFSSAEDPWSLPIPKQWDTPPADPLSQQDTPDEPAQHHSAQTSPAVIQTSSMEGSVWGEEPPLLNNQASAVVNTHEDHSGVSDPLLALHINGASMGDFHSWAEAVRKTYAATSADVITVSELSEREGLLFKHTNYLIEHHVALEGETEAPTTGERRVVRRYSEFVWLLEVLLKKYTFRFVPELPPKKLASGSDPLFLERRRRGLARFLNALVRHPVLKREPLVVMFLTVPTDLAGWRRQAQYDASEEFMDRKASTQFMSMWASAQKELEEMLKSAEDELKRALDNWNKICILVERLCVRQKQMAQDQQRISAAFSAFRESTGVLYPVEESRAPQINEGLREASKHVAIGKVILEEESTHEDEVIIEEFKRHFDFLLALRALFERYRRLGGNSIEQLSKRAETNEQKLHELQDKPDVKGAEVDRYTDSIAADRKEIARQTNRDWLIKENILTEFVMFQETQFQITRALQHWALNRVNHSEKHAENWSGLSLILQDMPMTRTD